jgi:hypothetical protein
MKLIIFSLSLTLLATSGLATDETSPTTKSKLTPEQAEARYTTAIDQRSEKIVQTLELSDTNMAAKVHDIIMAQYRALNGWHNTNDASLKAAKGDKVAVAKISASLKALHDEYLASLAQYLKPAQIEQVKDEMTYGKVQFTFKGYCVAYSNLSEANKQEILRLLKEAREEAMDGGSSDEKSAVFKRYKGKINNYLSKQSIHPEKKMSSGSTTNSPAK